MTGAVGLINSLSPLAQMNVTADPARRALSAAAGGAVSSLLKSTSASSTCEPALEEA